MKEISVFTINQKHTVGRGSRSSYRENHLTVLHYEKLFSFIVQSSNSAMKKYIRKYAGL